MNIISLVYIYLCWYNDAVLRIILRIITVIIYLFLYRIIYYPHYSNKERHVWRDFSSLLVLGDFLYMYTEFKWFSTLHHPYFVIGTVCMNKKKLYMVIKNKEIWQPLRPKSGHGLFQSRWIQIWNQYWDISIGIDAKVRSKVLKNGKNHFIRFLWPFNIIQFLHYYLTNVMILTGFYLPSKVN